MCVPLNVDLHCVHALYQLGEHVFLLAESLPPSIPRMLVIDLGAQLFRLAANLSSLQSVYSTRSAVGSLRLPQLACLFRSQSSAWLSLRWQSADYLVCVLPDKQSHNRNDGSRLRPLLSVKYRHISRSEEHTSELQSRPHLVCRL